MPSMLVVMYEIMMLCIIMRLFRSFGFGSFIRGFGVSDSDGSFSFLLYGTTPGSVLISGRPSGVDASIFPSLFSDCLVF
jgi:hypothetical protein